MPRSRWKKAHKGNTLRSGFELKTAKYLDDNKIKYEYETLAVKYEVPASAHTYKPDFILPNGIIVECKGRFTPADRKKMSLVIEQNPDMDIRLLFMVDNTLSRSSKTTYSAWCEKRNIKCHVSRNGEVPKEWFSKKSRSRRSS